MFLALHRVFRIIQAEELHNAWTLSHMKKTAAAPCILKKKNLRHGALFHEPLSYILCSCCGLCISWCKDAQISTWWSLFKQVLLWVFVIKHLALLKACEHQQNNSTLTCSLYFPTKPPEGKLLWIFNHPKALQFVCKFLWVLGCGLLGKLALNDLAFV